MDFEGATHGHGDDHRPRHTEQPRDDEERISTGVLAPKESPHERGSNQSRGSIEALEIMVCQFYALRLHFGQASAGIIIPGVGDSSFSSATAIEK